MAREVGLAHCLHTQGQSIIDILIKRTDLCQQQSTPQCRHKRLLVPSMALTNSLATIAHIFVFGGSLRITHLKRPPAHSCAKPEPLPSIHTPPLDAATHTIRGHIEHPIWAPTVPMHFFLILVQGLENRSQLIWSYPKLSNANGAPPPPTPMLAYDFAFILISPH